jgi:hypothetical protein
LFLSWPDISKSLPFDVILFFPQISSAYLLQKERFSAPISTHQWGEWLGGIDAGHA